MDYKKLGEKIEARSGWDFTDVNMETENPEEKWDYMDVVENFLSSDQKLLDIGTGGGEFLLKIAGNVDKVYGMDIKKSMIRKARENLKNSEVDNVDFEVADSEDLPFSENKFDIVICRHAPFSAEEVSKVLKEKGIFITQQVRENDKQNIKEVFGRGQNFDTENDRLLNNYVRDLKGEGFQILRKDVFNVSTHLKTMEDVIKLLKWAPIIPDFDLERESDKKSLKELESKYKTDRGIKTNTSRFLIIGCK